MATVYEPQRAYTSLRYCVTPLGLSALLWASTEIGKGPAWFDALAILFVINSGYYVLIWIDAVLETAFRHVATTCAAYRHAEAAATQTTHKKILR